MDESGVHFKFLFGPIYLFAHFFPIYLWLCLCARKKAPSAKKEVDAFPPRRVAEHCFVPFPCASWFTVMEGENGPGSIPTAHIVAPFLLKAVEIILAMEASRIIKVCLTFPSSCPCLHISCFFWRESGAANGSFKLLRYVWHAKLQALQDLQNADYYLVTLLLKHTS